MIYLGVPVLDKYPDFDKSVDHGTLDDFVYDSASGGKSVPWKATTRPRRTLALTFMLDGLREIKEMRSFFAQRDGRRGAFWLPTRLTDYALVDDGLAGDTVIVIKTIDVAAKIALSASFAYLAIITPDKQEFYHIEGSSISGQLETVTLDRGLDSNLMAGATVCCGLMMARLADDELQFNYECSDLAYLQLKFVELPVETGISAILGTRPIKLYKIVRGAITWRYTDWPVDLTIGSDTWLSADIEHGDIVSDIDFASDPVSLDVVTDDNAHPIRKMLSTRLIITSQVMIYECDASTLTPDFTAPIYKGRIGNVEFGAKGAIKVSMSSILRIGESKGPAVQVQRFCNHTTYDEFCTLNAADFTTSGTVSVIGEYYIEATAFGAKATAEGDANWFALGKVFLGSEIRLCVGQAGNRLYLNADFDSATVGDAISALAGDDRSIVICDGKFGNVDNFLGFPYIPNSNPQYQALMLPQSSGGKK